MADWYVSSVAYATYTAFQTSHAYVIGNIIVPTAPAVGAKYVFRCTTAGSSTTEPTWGTLNNQTSTSGTAIFTNISGQSSFFWTAAAGDAVTVTTASRLSAGDRVFISSDHTETNTSGTNVLGSSNVTGFGLIQWLSVSRAGSTPPVAADLLAGASIIGNIAAGSSALGFRIGCESYHYGITYSAISGNLNFGIAATTNGRSIYFDNCQVWLNQSTSTAIITASNHCTLILNNSTMKFGHIGQTIQNNPNVEFDVIWQNTPSNAIAGATFPTILFSPTTVGSSGIQEVVTCRGVDLSNITGSLVINGAGNCKYLFESCKTASGVTAYNTTGLVGNHELLEMVNCYNGTNFVSEIHNPLGDLTTEFTITLSSGATDNVGTFSHKMVSNANVNKFVSPLAGFWLDVGYTTTGSSKTATVEIISSTSLNNDEIALYLEYEGTAGSSLASFVDCFAGPLGSVSAVPTSTATWNSSPATPAKQKLQVTFTPRHAGRVRGQVRLGKASATVYVNPQITIT